MTEQTGPRTRAGPYAGYFPAQGAELRFSRVPSYLARQ